MIKTQSQNNEIRQIEKIANKVRREVEVKAMLEVDCEAWWKVRDKVRREVWEKVWVKAWRKLFE